MHRRCLGNKLGFTFLVIVSIVLLFTPEVQAHVHSYRNLQVATFSLDGVELTLQAPFLPAEFISSDSANAIQVATAVRWDSFKEISITAIPFGFESSTEGLPAAETGMERDYRRILEEYREQQGGSPQVGPVAHLFDKQVVSSVSVVNLHTMGSVASPVIITEWVVEAGSRIWVVRVSQSYEGGQLSQDAVSSFVSSLDSIRLSSPDVTLPSTSAAARSNSSVPTSVPEGPPPLFMATNNLPSPSWWNGDCDTNYYYSQTGVWAYPLGASYRGVKACGPRPYWDGAPNVLVHFFPGAWGEYEWQCVELSMRYLYLAYDIPPYSANGAEVVWNYSGTLLEKISNGTVGQAPQPGDVLSYNITAPYGHTSIVSASNVDSSGNGSITIVEQNASADGSRTHSVVNWYVYDSQDISGWLHFPGDTTPPGLASNVRPNGWIGPYTSDSAPRFQWDAATDNPDGSGMAGYYVAVDDWTPDGVHGHDWWAGNVTRVYLPNCEHERKVRL